MSPIRLCMRNPGVVQTCQAAAVQLLALLQRIGRLTLTQTRGTCVVNGT